MFCRALVATVIGFLVTPASLFALERCVSTAELCSRADLIVVARCEAAPDVNGKRTPSTYSNGFFTESKVVLLVERCLKGDQSLRSVLVRSGGRTVVPVPANYEIGSTVIAFLRRPEGGDVWGTVGDHQGVMSDRESVRRRLAELIAMQQSGAGYQRQPRYIAWVLDCLENPSTTKLALDANGRLISDELRSQTKLDRDQKKRLLETILRQRDNPYVLQLVPLVTDLHDPRLEKQLRDALETAKQSPACENAEPLMEAINAIDPSDQRLRIVDTYRHLAPPHGGDFGMHRTVVNEFLKSMQPAKTRFP